MFRGETAVWISKIPQEIQDFPDLTLAKGVVVEGSRIFTSLGTNLASSTTQPLLCPLG